MTTPLTTGTGDLYYSDGTDVGTKLFTEGDTTKPLVTQATILAVTDSVMYLKGEITNSGLGVELIKTDGTVAGTKVIKDFVEGTLGSESNSIGFHINKKELYFIGYSAKSVPPTNIGTSLWKSNGTAEGTSLVKNLDKSSGPTFLPVYNYSMYTYKGNMYYNNWVESNIGSFNLWRTDGTEAGTVRFEKDSGYISLGFTEYLNDMYYLDGSKNHEIWKTDGTNKSFVYKTGLFDEQKARIKTFLIKGNLYYFYTDNSSTANYSDLIEITANSAKSLVKNFPNFVNIYDVHQVGEVLYLKIQTTDKGIELFKLTFTTSTTELQAVQVLTLYPNPSNGDITIDSPDHGVLKIYNLMGQQVFQQQIGQIGKILVSPNLPSGSYEVVLTGKSKQYQNKLIITK